MELLTQNFIFWYILLHIVIGTLSWGWWNYSTTMELYDKFADLYKHYNYGIDDTDRLLSPVGKFRDLLVFFVAIFGGPATLVIVLLHHCIGIVKLKRGLKFT